MSDTLHSDEAVEWGVRGGDRGGERRGVRGGERRGELRGERRGERLGEQRLGDAQRLGVRGTGTAMRMPHLSGLWEKG